jgi:hypothetical protein
MLDPGTWDIEKKAAFAQLVIEPRNFQRDALKNERSEIRGDQNQ